MDWELPGRRCSLDTSVGALRFKSKKELIMKAGDLIKVLKQRPEAEVLVIAGKQKRTYVVEETSVMAHTVLLVALRTPCERDHLKDNDCEE